jgi:hypothetical protein
MICSAALRTLSTQKKRRKKNGKKKEKKKATSLGGEVGLSRFFGIKILPHNE